MDIDKAIELIEKNNTITGMHQIMRGLQILAKYEVDDDCCFEHDIIFAGNLEKTVPKMSEEDVLQMAKLGWFFYVENGCWAHY